MVAVSSFWLGAYEVVSSAMAISRLRSSSPPGAVKSSMRSGLEFYGRTARCSQRARASMAAGVSHHWGRVMDTETCETVGLVE